MATTVFAVNNGGSYSDYDVECLFTRREDAETFAQMRGCDLEACKKAVADRIAAARAEFAEWNLDWRTVGHLAPGMRIKWIEDGEN